jgi:hypothetical protein
MPAPGSNSDTALSLFEQVDLSHFSLPAPRPRLPPGEDPERERLAPRWNTLLAGAVEDPLLLRDAFAHFKAHSLGNALAALIQCRSRNLEPSPINTLPYWRDCGRKIKAGEKALLLCSPLEPPAAQAAADEESAGPASGNLFDAAERGTFEVAVWRPRWFVLSQTEPLNGHQALPPPAALLPYCWSRKQALQVLGVEWHELCASEDNLQSYSRPRSVAVARSAVHPERSLFHALAHVVLGHTESQNLGFDGDQDHHFRDYITLDSNAREVEAECVAMLLLGALALPGADDAAVFVEFWTEHDLLPEPKCQRIFEAADTILRAGLLFRTASPAPSPVPAPPAPPPESTPESIPESIPESTRTAPPPRNGPQAAWRLRYRLKRAYQELHPLEAAEKHTVAQAVRYLEGTDPEAAQHIKDLVRTASGLLKAAGQRLDLALDGIPEPEPAAPRLTKLERPLSPTRKAAASRTLGRQIRTELESERRRFFAVARRYELATDTTANQAMLKALSEYLQVPLNSRREPSATQWAQAASAIETQDLRW